MSDFGKESHPVARKLHKCIWCGENILIGEKHYRFAGKWEGDWQFWRMHNECEAVSPAPLPSPTTPPPVLRRRRRLVAR